MKRNVLIFCMILLVSTAWADKGAGPVVKYSNTGILALGADLMVTAFNEKIKAFGAGVWGEAVEGSDLMYGADFEVIYDMSPLKTWSLYISGGANYEWLKTPLTLEKALKGGVGCGLALHWKTSGLYVGYQALNVGADDHEFNLRFIKGL